MSRSELQLSVPKKYKDLVQLLARAFYAGECPPPGTDGEQQGRKKEPYTDVALVVLDALTRRGWVKEDDLAQDLKIGSKYLRRVLRYLEQQLILGREHRKEKVSAPTAPTPPPRSTTPTASNGEIAEGEEAAPARQVVVSYCKIDYPSLLEATQLRMHSLKAQLKKLAQDSSSEQHFRCTTSWCRREATTLDAFKLISALDGLFHCDVCDAVMEAADPTGEAGGLGGEHSERRAAAQRMQSKLQAQLQPLMALVDELAADAQRTGYVPDFRSLGEWLQEQERAAAEAGRATVELALPREFDSAARPQVDSGRDTGRGNVPSVLPPWLRPTADGGPQDLGANGNGDAFGNAAQENDWGWAEDDKDFKQDEKKVKLDFKPEAGAVKPEGGWDFDVTSGAQGFKKEDPGPLSTGHPTGGWVSVQHAGVPAAKEGVDADEDEEEWED